jgi:DNA-binding SARP family transcriptional activator
MCRVEPVAGTGVNAELRIWLLGEFRVVTDGHEVPAAAWSRSKARSLVKLLALAPAHRLHREQLMDALWPDLTPEAAAANLRKAIHFVRRAIGTGAVRVSNEVVRLDAAALWVDVDAFEAAAQAGDTDGALALYTDDLLLEDRFESWCERRRDQLRTVAAELLLDQSQALEARGDHRGAIAALERLLAFEPLNEAGHCGLIRLHAAAGRRHVALRWYRQLEDRLDVELGVAPGDEARRLRDEILAGENETLTVATPGADASSVRLDEERKLVTVVVVEFGGANRDAAPASPERVRSALDAAVVRAIDVLGHWGGRAERQLGGTVVAVFGVPSAGERDAERALRAALDVVDQATVPIRVGVDTGVVVARAALEVGLRGVAGEVVEIAGRLRELAGTGTVLASERTCRAARSVCVLADAEELRMAAGITPITAHRVLAIRGPTGQARSLLPMVGRNVQFDAVLGVFGAVASTGRPHLLTLVGHAGIGKSRLVAEVVPAVAHRWPGTVVRSGRCLSFGDGVTYWALGEILRETCGIAIGDPAPVARSRLDERLRVILAPLGLPDREVDATIAALAATAGIDLADGRFGQLPPKAAADELGRAWPRFAAALAATGPALLVIEDLHWADDQLLDMLERMVARAAFPLMILATARPELFDTHPGFGARSQAASVMSLPPLALDACRELLGGLEAARGLDETHRADVLARADGNPYFIEEMAIHLADDDSSALPDTLHSLLATRVDALPIFEKRVLQEASVMGRTFSEALLARRLPDEDVGAGLTGLERRGLIAANPAAAPGGYEEYAFKHALLRDVAYASVPAAQRADAHVAAATWLEELTSNRDELVELLALHYAAAADESAGTERSGIETIRPRAVATLLEAGAAARRRFALRKAVELHERALGLASTDEERLHALEELGDDDDAGYRGDAAARHYQAALAIARVSPGRDPDRSRLCRKFALMMAMNPGAFHVLPDPVTVEELIAEGLDIAPDAVSRAQLLVARGACARLWSGTEPFGAGTRPDPVIIQTRIDAVEEARRIGEELGLADLIDSAVNTLVILRGLASDYSGALALLERAIERVDEAPSTLARADILRTAAVHLIDLRARYEDGLEQAWRAYALTRDGAGPHQLMHVTYPLLAALYHLGRWSELDTLLDEHVTAFRTEPATHCHFVRDGPLIGAVVLARRGNLAAAGDLADLVIAASVDAASASAWQSFYEAVSGSPAIAVALSRDKMREGRMHGPQHVLAVLEAELAAENWDAVRTMLPAARADVVGNALLAPWCDRAEGMAAAAAGRRGDAEQALRRAARAFDDLGVRFEAARTREELAGLCLPSDAQALLSDALETYEELGAAPSAERVRSLLP